MSDDLDMRDSQWSALLTRSYGKVEASQSFRENLLHNLKAKQAEIHDEQNGEAPQADIGTDENWSCLLRNTYPAISARKGFRANLLNELKDKVAAASLTESMTEEEKPIYSLLKTSYVPVEPRQEFQTRLLVNLKERQKTSIKIKEEYRRRSIFSSFVSGLAAAAAVAFVVWLAPLNNELPASTNIGGEEIIAAPSIVQIAEIPAQAVGTPAPSASGIMPVAAIESASPNPDAAFPYSYNMEAAFGSSSLPKTARGVGMEINDGSGWRSMDETLLTRLSPGMAFRSTRPTAGLGFNDGSTVLMWPDSAITATDHGFAVDQGQLAVTVPHGSDSSLRLALNDRDVAIEPGTMLAVNAFFPEKYAAGGAPAPEVKVLDGGLAIARGKNGYAPLLANQVYLIDNYITPDIPGRPLCGAEWDELNGVYNSPPLLAGMNQNQNAYSPTQLVSASSTSPSHSASVPPGFSKQGTKWIADTYQEGAPVTKVKYLSPEYFALANSRRDLASSLAVGAEAIIDAGNDGFFEIHR